MMTNKMRKFRLRKIRESHGLTQTELARRLQVPTQYVWRWEAEGYCFPGQRYQILLEKFYGRKI